MPLTIKVPVKEIKANRPVCETVEEKLKADPQNGYTVMGLMVECYNVKESEINGKPFKQWKKGYPSLYTRIRTCLEKLYKAEKVGKSKQKQAYVYWWET
jgi:hypothetical protein